MWLINDSDWSAKILTNINQNILFPSSPICHTQRPNTILNNTVSSQVSPAVSAPVDVIVAFLSLFAAIFYHQFALMFTCTGHGQAPEIMELCNYLESGICAVRCWRKMMKIMVFKSTLPTPPSTTTINYYGDEMVIFTRNCFLIYVFLLDKQFSCEGSLHLVCGQ